VNEKDLLSSLVKTLRSGIPHSYIVKHSERIVGGTIGVPDITVTANKYTSWYEGKYADQTFSSDGRQDLSMLMLANYAHHARYIIYEKVGKVKRTYIVHPNDLKNWVTHFEYCFDGYNHEAVCNYIRGVHKIE
jgi:hypothetical protein